MADAQARTFCRSLFKQLEVPPVACLYILLLVNFIIDNQEIFQKKNSSICTINTRNKHHLHRPNANLSCFQNSTFCAGIKLFNCLPPSVTILKNDKAKFRAALRKYLYTHCFYSVGEFFVCKDDLCFCKMFVVFYTISLYVCVFMTCSTSYCLYDTLMSPWNVCMYVRTE